MNNNNNNNNNNNKQYVYTQMTILQLVRLALLRRTFMVLR